MSVSCATLLGEVSVLQAGLATKTVNSTTSNIVGPVNFTNTTDAINTSTCPLTFSPPSTQPSLTVCGSQGLSLAKSLISGGSITVYGNANIAGAETTNSLTVGGSVGINNSKGQFFAVGGQGLQLFMQQGSVTFPPFNVEGFIQFPVPYAFLGDTAPGLFTKCFGATLFQKFIYGIFVLTPFVPVPTTVTWFAIGPIPTNSAIFSTVSVTDTAPAVCGVSAPLMVDGGMDIESLLCVGNGMTINNGLIAANASVDSVFGSVTFNGPVKIGLDTPQSYILINNFGAGTLSRVGTASLAPLGSFTVFNDTLTTNTIVLISRITFASVISNTGFLSYTPPITGLGGSFTINSTNVNDNGTVAWFLIEKA